MIQVLLLIVQITINELQVRCICNYQLMMAGVLIPIYRLRDDTSSEGLIISIEFK